MDYIYIRDLKIAAIIGTYAWERQIKQMLSLNIEIGIDAASLALTENLEAGVDYAGLAQRVTDFVQASEFLLIEALAEAISTLILEQFEVSFVKLDLAKLGALPNAKAVGVVIERKKL